MPMIVDDFTAWATDNTMPTDRISLITGEIGIYGKDPLVWSEMKQLMLTATERVVLQTPYIVCSKAMYRDLADIAKTAPTQIITNSIVNTDNWFTPLDYLYHQDEILDTGVMIHELDGELSTHAKTVLIDDDLVLIGSYNLDLRTTYVSTELMVVIDSEALGERISESFDQQAENGSTLVREGTLVSDRVRELPLPKRILWYIVGVILQPFRFEL
jgi:phosphatidylserine/phosphatidylglycerophosphate/cardiolipin synthase-like enzyme